MSANFLSGLFKNWGWTIIREIWALFSASGSVFCVFFVTHVFCYFPSDLLCQKFNLSSSTLQSGREKIIGRKSFWHFSFISYDKSSYMSSFLFCVFYFHLCLYLSLLFAVVLCVSEEEWVGGGTRLFYDNHKSQRAPPGPTAAFSLFSTFMPYLPHSFIT